MTRSSWIVGNQETTFPVRQNKLVLIVVSALTTHVVTTAESGYSPASSGISSTGTGIISSDLLSTTETALSLFDDMCHLLPTTDSADAFANELLQEATADAKLRPLERRAEV